MRIYIARHWETEENKLHIFQWHLPWTLSEEWITQAKKLALRLKDEVFDVIYCSDQKRAKDTLWEILKLNNCKNVFFTEQLRDRAWWNMTWMKVSEIDWSKSIWVETNMDLKNRAWIFLNELKQKHINENVLLVSHGWCIKWIYSHIDDLKEEEMEWVFHISNCSLSLMELDSNWVKKVFFNNSDHIND